MSNVIKVLYENVLIGCFNVVKYREHLIKSKAMDF